MEVAVVVLIVVVVVVVAAAAAVVVAVFFQLCGLRFNFSSIFNVVHASDCCADN